VVERYWVILRKAKNLGLAGKNVLVVGCGLATTRSNLRISGVDQSSRHFRGIGRDRPATGRRFSCLG